VALGEAKNALYFESQIRSYDQMVEKDLRSQAVAFFIIAAANH